MNTTLRGLEQTRRFHAAIPTPWLPIKKPKLVNIVLIAILLLSAFTVIYVKDVNRRLFIRYQTLQATHTKLYEDWEKLLLEQSTWSTQARIQKIAQQRLLMSVPAQHEVAVLKVPHPD